MRELRHPYGRSRCRRRECIRQVWRSSRCRRAGNRRESEGARGEAYELRARIRAGAAAVDAHFIAILKGVGALGFDAHTCLTDAALTIVWRAATCVGLAFPAIGTATIIVRFATVFDEVHARRNRANTRDANAARALAAIDAHLAVGTGRTPGCSAIDIAFSRIFRPVGTLHIDACVHFAREATRAALNAVDTRHAGAIAIANALRAIRLRADRPLSHGLMREHPTRADVGGAFFRVVVNIFIVRDGLDVERTVALFLLAISIKLRRQCRARRLQALTAAFAIGAIRRTTEVDGTIVFAIVRGRALRHPAAAAGRASAISSGTAVATIAAAAGPRRAPGGIRFGFVTTANEMNSNDPEGRREQPSFFQFHDKHSSRLLTCTLGAQAGLAIFGVKAFLHRRTFLGVHDLGARTTTIDIRFIAIENGIGAGRRDARQSTCGIACAFAIAVCPAHQARTAWKTIWSTAIDIRFVTVLHRIGAGCKNAPIVTTGRRGTILVYDAIDALEIGALTGRIAPWRRTHHAIVGHGHGRGITSLLVTRISPIVGVFYVIAGGIHDATFAVTFSIQAIPVDLRCREGPLARVAPHANPAGAGCWGLAFTSLAVVERHAFRTAVAARTTRASSTASRRRHHAARPRTGAAHTSTARIRVVLEGKGFDARHRRRSGGKYKRKDQEPRDSLHRRLLPTLLDAAQRTEGLSGDESSKPYTDERHDGHERPPYAEVARADRRNTDVLMVANTVSEREYSGTFASTIRRWCSEVAPTRAHADNSTLTRHASNATMEQHRNDFAESG